jgi:hypothetical protein
VGIVNLIDIGQFKRWSGRRGALRIKLVRGETAAHQNRADFADRGSPPALAAASH